MSDVFVFGAGFTRAFFPRSPLLVDHYPLDLPPELSSDYVAGIIDSAGASASDGRIDLERLMTRCGSPLPYDSPTDRAQLTLLMDHLIRVFRKQLDTARSEQGPAFPLLRSLAKFIIERDVTCVTFNYDDVVDEALVHASPGGSYGNSWSVSHWNPDGGYGFFCEPSSNCVASPTNYMDVRNGGLLLKLHGSTNWRVRLGSRRPLRVGDIYHHEAWSEEDPRLVGYFGSVEKARDEVEALLDPTPFIVPPTLTKSELGSEPVLSLLWRSAHLALSAADRITFVGYSLPVTDLSARFLFREAINDPAKILVVDIEEGRVPVTNSYRTLFPGLQDSQFEWDGAARWVERLSPLTGAP